MRLAAWATRVLAVGLLTTAGAGADDWSLKVDVRPDPPVVGQAFEVWLTVECSLPGSPRVEVTQPVWGSDLVPDRASFQSYSWVNGVFQYTQCWSIVGQTAGEVELPPIRVTLKRPDNGALETKVAPHQVIRLAASAAQQDQGSQARPDPVRSVQRRGLTPFQWGVVGGLGLLLLATLALAFANLRAAPELQAAAALWGVLPDSAEGRALTALREPAFTGPEVTPPALYAGLAVVLTAWLIEHLGLAVGMLTTSEAKQHLAASDFPEAERTVILEALAASDQVRFARGGGDIDQAKALARRVEGLLIEAGRRAAKQ